MSTPQAPPSQPGQPPAQPPPPQQDGLDDAALAVALSGLLITAVSAAAVIGTLRFRFALSAYAWTALEGVLTDVMQAPPPVTGVVGAASAQTLRMNAARRAQYVLAAARRTVGAMRQARAQGTPVLGALRDQLATERRYYSAHQQAMWGRATAAGKTDMEAAVHGDLLGWNSVLDSRTSPECRAADGCNYRASQIPDIGLPGSVHLHCRCFPSAPHPGGRLLPSRGRRFARAA